ncbi:hypothetical protein GCM10020000_43010 [Streptomyces olivoverticillatus]
MTCTFSPRPGFPAGAKSCPGQGGDTTRALVVLAIPALWSPDLTGFTALLLLVLLLVLLLGALGALIPRLVGPADVQPVNGLFDRSVRRAVGENPAPRPVFAPLR